MVDVPLAHLDRAFDYLVPDSMSADAVPGARVRVRFAGRLVNGFITERVAVSDHTRLQPLQRVYSPVPVLTPEITELARAVADRYAGTLSDVLRTAIPPRHARAESIVLAEPPVAEPAPADAPLNDDESPSPWSAYVGGAALRSRIAAGARKIRAVWDAAPGAGLGPAGDWPTAIADLAAAAVPRGGVVIVVPDARDLARVDVALTERLGAGQHVTLSADLGPQRRYSHFLRALTGRVPVVLGTRAAAFAPVVDPALFILWDDSDESLSEPHSPYWHAREVLALRSHLTGASLVVGGFARSVETQSWIESAWAHPVSTERTLLRECAPRVTGDDSREQDGPARLPSRAWRAARAGLEEGPVLVQVSRRGYVPSLACQRCRTPATCVACGGPLGLPRAGAAPTCRWCGSQTPDWHCRECGSSAVRAIRVGSARTSDELGRAFPGVSIINSSGDHIVNRVETTALVVATPGAEPLAAGGYCAVLILDAESQLMRASLRSGEETARRWFGAAALARPGAPVVIVANPAAPLVQALVRWDPGGFAARELAERAALRLPPAVRSVDITGEASAVAEAAECIPPGVRMIGPHDARDSLRAGAEGPAARMLLTADRTEGPAMTAALQHLAATRSARKDARPLTIHVDPLDWGADLT